MTDERPDNRAPAVLKLDTRRQVLEIDRETLARALRRSKGEETPEPRRRE